MTSLTRSLTKSHPRKQLSMATANIARSRNKDRSAITVLIAVTCVETNAGFRPTVLPLFQADFCFGFLAIFGSALP
jgi:hypothetical protein